MQTLLAILSGLALLILLAAFVSHLYTRRIAARAEAVIPQAGTVTPVKGGAIHWVEQGAQRADRPTIVMIHGLGGNLHHFTYALAPLLAEEYHVVALDRPGCGYSVRENAARAALPEQARMIAEFLKERNIDKPVLVGHSLGGAIALQLALDHPEQVGVLALIAPLTHQVTEIPEMFKPLGIANATGRWLMAETVAVPMAVKYAEAALAAVFAPETPPADFAIRAGGVLGFRPKGFIAPSEDLVATQPPAVSRIAERLPTLSAAGGVLYGDKDAVLDPTFHGEALAKAAPSIELELIEGVGHMIPLTEPERCAAFVRRQARKVA